MRISDWSSDVCSSDLQIELFASKTYTGPWGISQVEPEAWPRGLRGMRVQRFDHCQLHGQDIEAMRDLLAEVLGFYVTEHVVDADGGNLAIFMSLAMRSEEHTSELQSLMRLSYAVFCLKKKNIKTQR